MDQKRDTLNIAISTLRTNFDELLRYLLTIKDKMPLRVSFLVISQLEFEDEFYEFEGIKVFKCREKGLSKSRNLALRECNSEWIWFQDDDIRLLTNRIPMLVDYLDCLDKDMLLVKVASLENPTKPFKDYGRYSIFARFLAFRISSIEIVAKVNFLRENNLKFDEKLGLGSALPSCEENLFFYQSVIESKARFKVYDQSVCLHTTLVESRGIDYQARYQAKGYLLGKMRKLTSPLVLFWWTTRKSNDGISRRLRLRLMLNKYLSSLFTD